MTRDEIAAHLAADPLTEKHGLVLTLRGGDDITAVPKLALAIPAARAADVIRSMEAASTPDCVDQSEHIAGVLVFNPVCLAQHQARAVSETTLASVRDVFGA